MRRLSERARLEGMLALRKALDGVRRGQNAALAAGDGIVHPPWANRQNDFSDRVDRAQAERDGSPHTDVPERVVPERGVAERGVPDELEDDIDLVADTAALMLERDLEFMKGLDRIADSIERVAAQLDSYHQERAEHLDAIEFLLREMVIGTVPATATRPIVLGGVIDSNEMDREDREISRGEALNCAHSSIDLRKISKDPGPDRGA